MKKVIFTLAVVTGSFAQASGLPEISAVPLMSTAAPFFSTGATFGMPLSKRIVADAQEDAAMFIGSNGAVRGAQLEQALLVIRQSNPELRASDMDLANKILAETN